MADPGFANGGQGRAPQARLSRRRRLRAGGVWGGGVPLPNGNGSGKGALPLARKFFDFGSENGDF